MLHYYLNRIADLTLRQMLQHSFGRGKGTPDGSVPLPSPCVFTLSTGRSGTKSLAALASLAGNVLAFHEPLPKLYGLSFLCHGLPSDEPIEAIFREAFLTARRDRLHYACSFAKGYLETSPQATFLAPVIGRAVPGVKFIHVTRDPRDYIRSGIRRRWYVDHPMDRSRIAPPGGSEQGVRWPDLSPFEKIVWLWQETNTWIDRFLSGLPPEQCLRLKAEDIFAMDPTAIAAYFHFLQSPVPAPKRIRRVLAKRLNAQTSGDFPDYTQWPSAMRQYLVKHVAETADRFGYRL